MAGLPGREALTVWFDESFATQISSPEGAIGELRRGVGEGLVVSKEPPSDAEVAFGQPAPEVLLRLPSLRWAQVSSAGYTRYDRDEFRDALKAKGAALTNSSSVFDDPCAQHLVAMMLAFARQLPQALLEQTGGRDWSGERRRLDSFLLQEGRLLIVGYGAIARRVVELLTPFRMDIVAVRRNVRGDEAVPTHAIDRLDDLLPQADHVANILPANDSTNGLFDAERFARMKPGAFFYNIGRGTTVDQNALLGALSRLGGAYLDVTDPEPLPEEHPLWTAPKTFITPHSAGGHRGEEHRLVRHFLDNLARYRRGETLRNRVV